MGSLQFPISIEPDLPPPIARPPRVPTFRYPIPDHTLDGWKAKIAVDSHGAIELARAMGQSLLASLPQHAGGAPSVPGSASIGMEKDIHGLAHDIQTILGDALSEATKMFPLKTHNPPSKGTLPRHLWPKQVR